MRLEPLRNIATEQVLIRTEHDGVTTGGAKTAGTLRLQRSNCKQYHKRRGYEQAANEQHDSPSLIVSASMRVAVKHDIRFLS